MTNTITPFNFGQSTIRVIQRDGSPWFVAADICEALGYANSRKAIADHLDDDERGVTTSDTLGGKQKLTIISESGLYALVLRSRKPEARKFAKWVTSEVLPSIRKTGGYQTTASESAAIDPLNGPALVAVRKVAEDYFESYRQAVQSGQPTPRMGEMPPEVLHGIMARALLNQRMLSWFNWDTGTMGCKLIPSDSSVFSLTSGNYSDLLEQVPMERLPEMAEAVNKRVACHLGAFSSYLRDRRTSTGLIGGQA